MVRSTLCPKKYVFSQKRQSQGRITRLRSIIWIYRFNKFQLSSVVPVSTAPILANDAAFACLVIQPHSIRPGEAGRTGFLIFDPDQSFSSLMQAQSASLGSRCNSPIAVTLLVGNPVDPVSMTSRPWLRLFRHIGNHVCDHAGNHVSATMLTIQAQSIHLRLA